MKLLYSQETCSRSLAIILCPYIYGFLLMPKIQVKLDIRDMLEITLVYNNPCRKTVYVLVFKHFQRHVFMHGYNLQPVKVCAFIAVKIYIISN